MPTPRITRLRLSSEIIESSAKSCAKPTKSSSPTSSSIAAAATATCSTTTCSTTTCSTSTGATATGSTSSTATPMSWSAMDLRTESILVSHVLHRTHVASRLDQRVFSVNCVTVSGFFVMLHVTGVVIVHSVRKMVFGMMVIVMAVPVATATSATSTTSAVSSSSSSATTTTDAKTISSTQHKRQGNSQEKCDLKHNECH